MKSMDLAIFLSFLCICSYVLTVIGSMLPALFSRWYTLFIQNMLFVWLCLDNFTLVCDLRNALDAEGLSQSRVDSLERKTAHFSAALADAELRLAHAIDQVAAVENKCRNLEKCLRSAVEINTGPSF